MKAIKTPTLFKTDNEDFGARANGPSVQLIDDTGAASDTPVMIREMPASVAAQVAEILIAAAKEAGYKPKRSPRKPVDKKAAKK